MRTTSDEYSARCLTFRCCPTKSFSPLLLFSPFSKSPQSYFHHRSYGIVVIIIVLLCSHRRLNRPSCAVVAASDVGENDKTNAIRRQKRTTRSFFIIKQSSHNPSRGHGRRSDEHKKHPLIARRGGFIAHDFLG